MKPLLMHRHAGFDFAGPVPAARDALMQDLELDRVLSAMAAGDAFVRSVSTHALLTSVANDLDTIRYRQQALADCIANAGFARLLLAQSEAALEVRRKHWMGGFAKSPSSILSASVRILVDLVEKLAELQHSVAGEAWRFESDAFTRFFTMLASELDDAYLAQVREQLDALRLDDGMLMSAKLGPWNENHAHVLRAGGSTRSGWFARVLAVITGSNADLTFQVAERDDIGAKILGELRDRATNDAANVIAQSAEHVLSFFAALRTELAFYVGALNLHAHLASLDATLCFPRAQPAKSRTFNVDRLYDITLALSLSRAIVGTSANGDGRDVVIVTGANQGGKWSFLRGYGVAQLMMQCGLFVGADAFASEICDGLFTHYRREEDATMTRGKLDEELRRMSTIVDKFGANPIVLFNESFAATNEREGSEIARQIVDALAEKNVKVFFVTHLYDFAPAQYTTAAQRTLFLRAERSEDGERPYALRTAEPLATSYGEDLYRLVFEKRGPSGNANVRA